MARPRKISTDEMLKIVNDCYEEHGDASRLKCVSLANFAASRGFDIKDYDFRRNPAVRDRIGELSDILPLSTEGEPFVYKGLDVDAFINRARSQEALKNALIELDGAWRKIYNRACSLLKEKEALAHDLQQKILDCEKLERDYGELSSKMAEIRGENKDILLKNRYLTNAVKEYLYPAIANEILKNEGSIERVDTEATPAAMAALTDTGVPASFSKSIEDDRRTLSREENLLRRMADVIKGGDSNA